MLRNFWMNLMLIALMLLGIGGCALPATQMPFPSETVSPPAPPVQVTLPPTATEVPATTTPSPSPSITPQPPTETPQPTLSAEGMKTAILELMKDNGGCRLPCLWGLTPGKTDYDTFHDFTEQFYNLDTPDAYVSIWRLDISRFFTLSYRENSVHIFVQLADVADDESKHLDMLTINGYSMAEFGNTPEGGVDLRFNYGDPLFLQTFQYYTLPSILSTYGRPGRVLLATWPDDPSYTPSTTWPFSLVLFYPEQGIFVEYVSIRETAGDHFVGCPAKAHIHLGVWDPERALPLKYIVQKAGSEINELNLDYFQSVEEATALTLDEFYETFKHPENTACLETPIDLWKP